MRKRLIKWLSVFLLLILLLWISFLFTFSKLYPVADKVEQASQTEIAERHTPYVTMQQIPKLFVESIVQTEDERFYLHIGIDIEGIGRSVWTDVRTQKAEQGGSTLTQQLIRNTVISPERTFTRKMKEMVLAVALERFMNKNRILELYLNVVYFGHGAYGAEQAAETYFGKSLAELSLPEWSLLAGLPNAPSAYDPYVAMELAKERQRDVLNHLVSAHLITTEKANEAEKAAIHLKPA